MTPANPPAPRRQAFRLRLLGGALGVALLGLLAALGLLARQLSHTMASVERQVVLNARLPVLDDTVLALTDAESGQRGFLLTGKPSYLETYGAVTKRLPGLLAELRQLSDDEPGFGARVRPILALADRKLEELALTVRLFGDGQADDAMAIVQQDDGQRDMEHMRAAYRDAAAAIRAEQLQLGEAIVREQRTTLRVAAAATFAFVVTAALALAQIASLSAARRRHADALQRSEAQHRSILDEQQELVSLSDADGHFTFVNPAFAQQFGLAPADVVGRSLYDFVPDDERPAVRAHLAEVLATGRAKRSENRIRAASGALRVVAWSNQVQVGPDGRPLLHSVGRDVTHEKELEQRLTDIVEIFEATPDAVVQVQNGRITYLNPAGRRILGVSPDVDLTGLSYTQFHTAETNALLAGVAAPVARAHGAWVGETAVQTPDGRVIPMNELLIAHAAAGGDGRDVQRFSAVMRDITEVVEARRELALQTSTLAAVIEAIPALVAVYDGDCRYRLVNRAFEAWTGVPRDRCIGRRIDEVFGEAELQQTRPWADRALAGETVSYDKDVASTGRPRSIQVSYVPLRLDQGAVVGFVGVGHDVTAQRAEARRLTHLAERDPLTSLRNRAGFESHLNECAATGQLPEVALLYVDLDRFKPVNDRHGHAVGDEVLRQFADRLVQIIRPSDVAARLGGDEFAVVLTGVRSRADADRVADKVVAMAQRPFEVAGTTVSIGASVGVSHGAAPSTGWTDLVDQADRDMYQAKALARGAPG